MGKTPQREEDCDFQRVYKKLTVAKVIEWKVEVVDVLGSLAVVPRDCVLTQ